MASSQSPTGLGSTQSRVEGSLHKMTSLNASLGVANQSNVNSTQKSMSGTAFYANGSLVRRESRVYDTAAWAFKDSNEVITPNLAFLPILGLFLLVVCSSLKAYKWSRENSRMKARGDVEIWDEDDANYGILHEGDKNYLHVDIRGDGSSLYDTINSFRMLGSGNVPSPSYGPHPYHDSVTSYKSLLMQRPDNGQYDSVKSYKAFLQKVTQNKDLAVEVKLLENYPLKSKSAEHFVVVEEESSDKTESLTSKVLSALPLRKQFSAILPDKKKARGRCASGDMLTSQRKRSASNPTSRRIARRAAAASSLPSIQCHSSSDSDEDAFKSFREDRKRMWAERKKMCRSVSGSKISKAGTAVYGAGAVATPGSVGRSSGTAGTAAGPKRRRHFSADSARRLRKPDWSSARHEATGGSHDSNLDSGMKMLSKPSQAGTCSKSRSERAPRPAENNRNDSETSENPTSSHSSCENWDVRSDAMESYSNEDDDTKLCTHLSNISDDQTIDDDDVFHSVDMETGALSSSELLASSQGLGSSSSRKQLARAKEDFFTEEPRATYIDITQLSSEPAPDVTSAGNVNERREKDITIGGSGSMHTCQKTSPSHRPNSRGQKSHFSEPSMPHGSPCELRGCSKAQDTTSSNSDTGGSNPAGLVSTEFLPQHSQSPRKVQRFHVTFVNSDISSLNSE